MQDLEGRTAFVTGGASGIGLGIVQALLEAGMQAVIADLRPDHIEAAMAGFQAAGQGRRVAAVQLDVTDREAFAAAEREARRLFGAVDVLVSNAGVGITGPVATATYADWDFGLGVNLGGTVNALVTFLPGMIEAGRGGHVVITASQAGITPSPRGAAIYAASKGALVGLAEGIREELGDHGIGVSVLLAGFFRSNIGATGSYRPVRFREGSGYSESEGRGGPPPADSALWREPIEAGQVTLQAIRDNALYIATHGELKGWAEGRFEEILAAYPPAQDQALAKAMGRRRQADPFSLAAALRRTATEKPSS